MDTLKVLAKRIAPGQEHLDAKYEADAKRDWYSDYGLEKRNMIYVSGGRNILDKLSALRSPDKTVNDDAVWGFDSRSHADLFAGQLMMLGNVSFWQLGLSNQLACPHEFPLLASFLEVERKVHWWGSDKSRRTEVARAFAYRLLSPIGRCRGYSAVILDGEGFETENMPLEPRSNFQSPIGFFRKRRGSSSVKNENLHYTIFSDSSEARRFFVRAAGQQKGMGWHFGAEH